jgi:hypothetical protein
MILSLQAKMERKIAAARQFAPPVDSQGRPTGPSPTYTYSAQDGSLLGVTTHPETGTPKTHIYSEPLGRFVPGTIGEPSA